MLIYLENLLKSEGILASVQFAFTALLTLLIPLVVVLFEKRTNPRYEIDKKVIDKLVRFEFLIISTIIASILIFFISNDKETNNFYLNLIIIIILIFPFIYLVLVNFEIAKALRDLQDFREKYLQENKNSDVLDFWEEYFLN